MRDETVKVSTEKTNNILASVKNKAYVEIPIKDMQALIALTMPDQRKSERIWNPIAVAESLAQFAKLHEHATGYVYVDRERGLMENRRETQGILDSGEAERVPSNKITLFLLRTEATRGHNQAWWPQIRFPGGRYAFAFAV